MRPQRACRQQHGTNARYVAGCSCLACCDAHAAYQRDRGPRPARTKVPLDEVAAHVHRLKRKGMSRRAIAEMAGVSYHTLRNIEGAVYVGVTRETADALLTLAGPITSDTTALIPAGPTMQLLARATAQGVSIAAIAAECGLSRKSLPQPTQRCVQARTAKRVAEAVERLLPGAVRRRGTMEYRIVHGSLELIADVNGWDVDAVLDGAGVDRLTAQQLRFNSRPISEERAERIAAAFCVSVGSIADRIERSRP